MKKNMNYNFNLLYERIIDTNKVSNLKKIRQQLASISESVICVGNGGSSVVSEFASKVLIEKNKCITLLREPRDLNYDESVKLFKELFICSYSGKNCGVETALQSPLSKRLFTANNSLRDGVDVIAYASTLEKERSFISLGTTLVPTSILLNYYVDGDNFNNIIDSMFQGVNNYQVKNHNFEILTGYDTSVASKYLTTTITEAGLGMAVCHNKYDFCHGRTTLAYHLKNQTLIYLKTSETELDNLLLESAKDLYNDIIVLESNYNDLILDNFNLLIQSMYLTKEIAEQQKKDLSDINYSPVVKKLFFFKGKM